MSVAAATREAVRDRPALYDALRAGVVNYTAAADTLDVDGDREAIATALRRFAAELAGDAGSTDRSITVRLHSDAATVETLLSVDGSAVGGTDSGAGDSEPTTGDRGDSATGDPEPTADDGGASAGEPGGAPVVDTPTAVEVTGTVDARLLAAVLDRLRIADVSVGGAGMAGGSLVVVVPRREGPTAVRLIESTADAV